MKMMLKGGRVVDPADGRDGEFDVLIEDGRIARIGKDLPVDGADVLEVQRGWIVAPGPDRHPRPPARARPGAQGNRRHRHGLRRRRRIHRGRLHAEHRSGERSRRDHASSSCKKAAEAQLARVYPIGAVSIGSRGEQLSELGEQKAAGCVAFTDDGRPVASALLMRRALEYAGMLGVPIIDHCEDPSLKGDGVAHEGFYAARLGLRGIPGVAESIMVERDIVARGADRRARPHRAHERAPVAARRPRRQGARRPTSRARWRRTTSR